jgi:hypothetical protein
VPYCESCAKYLTPTSLHEDGTCPTCQRPVGQTEDRARQVAAEESAPWHFKLLVAATVVYLGWRFVQLVF